MPVHLLSLILLFIPTLSFAWNTTGHAVVANVAECYLEPKARAAVQELLVDETMASVAGWMDRVRSQPDHRHTSTWHWVTIPDGMTYASSEKNPKGDVVEAIERMAATLGSDTASIGQKRLALRYLIHMVGDLHQPLHVGNGLDKGGNEFQVRWMGRGSNLHKVWDSGIFEAIGQDHTVITESLKVVDRRTLRKLRRGTPADWAQECVDLRQNAYTVAPGAEIGEEYARAHWDLVCQQLQAGGVRLAWLLNKALA